MTYNACKIRLEKKSFWALKFIIKSKLHAISCLISDNNQQDKKPQKSTDPA